MKKLIIKLILFFSPFLVPVILFLLFDPFMLVGSHRGNIKSADNYVVTWNRDVQSTELFKKNFEKQNYNSFIFGNSRSGFYRCSTWEKFIEGNTFHFDASGENIFGIEAKLRYLDKKNVEIKNVLLIVDSSTLAGTEEIAGHLFIKHPELTNSSYLSFYTSMFRGFFPKPTMAFTDLFIKGQRKEYMDEFGIRENVWKFDYTTNECSYFLYDSILRVNPDLYYADKMDLFYSRDTSQLIFEPTIGDKQRELLASIHSILTKHNVNFKVVVSPLYNQKKLAQTDVQYLDSLFGSKNIFDFSGINEMTSNYQNYYETSHYRTHVSDTIIHTIYRND
jgi:hypothetical protein